MKNILKMIVAAIVAVGMACVAIVHDASDNLVIVMMFTIGIAVAAALGVFDVFAKSKHMSIKNSARHYDQAA